ncbi:MULTISPECIES: DUF1830 domain-containing protein [unclassified Thermosynechococcus]|uniref:DUF1830 domain-containing protein n=1 Tax=unclassified Thermosynechococcus TaxID=2622553 RepID=UPI001980E0D4|nr:MULTISPECIES: DUF1830 domain-containing protein [unclassified Thermosynechococcus]QSF49861.1 DUF1830 domain-containing protein [Thermosynechococcus sp. TA-1]WNC22960.1 DUF1830 domain-containing protein [Thermosynechococcus sp. PP22]WNC33202.1 DUF1830 domain-containing protein [Thermosynechococcus sp. PKX95]WNC35726.1 DUF1830 domain-containing protein [Thermosynechococcus sp. PKX91]WNC38250.1 DUF1830 domain-containing protein [Thermosynechococcus sp. WL11]
MPQIFDPVPSDSCDRILCCYVNATSKIQVVRITNIPNWYFERVVFPGQRLFFESPPAGQLEVHSGTMASALLADTIPCCKLQVQERADHVFVHDGNPQPWLQWYDESAAATEKVMLH